MACIASVMAYGLDADTAQKMCFDSALALGANPTADAVLKAVTKTLFLKDNGSSQALDTMFLLYSAFLVFLMQAGFAMVCAGSIRSKNVINILLKNLLDAGAGGISWYCLGHGFAFGDNPSSTANGFIGNWDFALSYTTHKSYDLAAASTVTPYNTWAMWLFQWSFAAAATTIVSGAMAERTTQIGYLGYAFFMPAFVYPVVVHWAWSPNGWLSALNAASAPLKTGVIDYAGSGVVHMVGGTAALVGAYIVGPRMGRFDPSTGTATEIRGHSASIMVLGTFLLWVGWYGFNTGSQLCIDCDSKGGLSAAYHSMVTGRVAVTTTLAGCSGALVGLFVQYLRTGTYDIKVVCNSILGGMVAITAGCAVVEPWAAIIAGSLAAVIYIYAEKAVEMAKIDDPVSAVAVHMCCGAFGLIFVGFLAVPRYVESLYGFDLEEKKYGILYGGNGQLLLCQFIFVLVIVGWVGALMYAYFKIFYALGMLRILPEEELAGLDVSKHGGGAYVGMGDAVPYIDASSV